MFGAADISSSDGQGFPTAGRGEAVGAINAHYGREVSALFYTHVSARHAPYHTVAIPPSGEAAQVIDGLLYHEADLSIAVHHTDGGGVSDHVFALAHLLGFRFAPRIPNLAERRLYGFGPASNWPVLAPFIAGRADERLITAHWDDVRRLAASVRTGTVSASLILKRLGAYELGHPTASARPDQRRKAITELALWALFTRVSPTRTRFSSSARTRSNAAPVTTSGA